MDEDKLKIAFTRIKKDMDIIKSELLNLKKGNNLNDDIKKELQQLKNYNLEKFIVNLENEFKSINSLVREFNHRFKQNSVEIKKLSENLQKYHFEITQLKKKLSKESNLTANTELDIKLLDEKLSDLNEIINQKISLESAQNRLETQSELARMASDVAQIKNKKSKSEDTKNIENNLNEIAELLNEKMTLELNSMKLEFTEEIAKLYDTVYNEIMDIKKESINKNKTSSQTIIKKPVTKKIIKKTKTESLY